MIIVAISSWEIRSISASVWVKSNPPRRGSITRHGVSSPSSCTPISRAMSISRSWSAGGSRMRFVCTPKKVLRPRGKARLEGVTAIVVSTTAGAVQRGARAQAVSR